MSRLRWTVSVGLAFAVWLGWSLSHPPADGVRFFDVGQGDAALISAGRTQLLVDVGPDRSVLAPLGSSLPVFDRNIEFAVLSHPHTDHYRGLRDVIRRYHVGMLIVGVPGKEREYRDLIAEAEHHGTTVVPAAGQRIVLGPSVRAEVIEPSAPSPDEPVDDPNNASVVLMVRAGPSRILMTGDAGFEEEGRLLAAGHSLAADVLKVGHHGSRTSSGEEFLAAVRPRDAVISSGAGNTYGHPTAEALERLSAAGARVYRTDQRGTITLTFDASGYRLRTEH